MPKTEHADIAKIRRNNSDLIGHSPNIIESPGSDNQDEHNSTIRNSRTSSTLIKTVCKCVGVGHQGLVISGSPSILTLMYVFCHHSSSWLVVVGNVDGEAFVLFRMEPKGQHQKANTELFETSVLMCVYTHRVCGTTCVVDPIEALIWSKV